jgi:hypothetical protein
MTKTYIKKSNELSSMENDCREAITQRLYDFMAGEITMWINADIDPALAMLIAAHASIQVGTRQIALVDRMQSVQGKKKKANNMAIIKSRFSTLADYEVKDVGEIYVHE